MLRLEAQLAGAQQTQAETEALAMLTEEQLRILLLIPAGQPLAIGADVMHEDVTPMTESLAALQDQAMAHRLEIRALDETELSLKETVSIARRLPAADRRLRRRDDGQPQPARLPAKNQFDGTWDAGVRLSWTLNDTFTAMGATAEAKARVASLAEQKGIVRDGLRLEVVSAYPTCKNRWRRSRPRTGKSRPPKSRSASATSSSRTAKPPASSSSTARPRSRAPAWDASTRASASRVAKVRLDHATGRDVPQNKDAQ